MKKQLFSMFSVILAVILLAVPAFSAAGSVNEEPPCYYLDMFHAVEDVLSASLYRAEWTKTAENTVIALYSPRDAALGAAILEYDASTGFSVVVRNDNLVSSFKGSGSSGLEDTGPEYGIGVYYYDEPESDHLLLQRGEDGVWKITGLDFQKENPGQADTLVSCRLDGDGKTAVVYHQGGSKTERPAGREFTLAEFNLESTLKLCEEAVEPLRADSPASGREDPAVPVRFDCRMDEEQQLLFLSTGNQRTRTQSEWTFRWDDRADDWVLKTVMQAERDDPEPPAACAVTESVTEITPETLRTTKVIKDSVSGETLYACQGSTLPNVLPPEYYCLKNYNFSDNLVNGNGYRWAANWMHADDPDLPRLLFDYFFPGRDYEDGYLFENNTLMFLTRKADGTLVLLCGADEGENNWEWIESSPLPPETEIGDNNITDAVNMTALDNGASVGVGRTGKGQWGISYVNSYDFFVGSNWVRRPGNDTDELFFGTHAWGDITNIDWLSFPPDYASCEESVRLSALVDRTGWATPAQRDPGAETGLLEKAGDESTLLGRFYNGTPLFVLERGEEWTKVRIGRGGDAGVLTGWMRTDELAFGDDILGVNKESLHYAGEKILIPPVETFIGSRAGKITKDQFSDSLIIGEVETDQPYVIIYTLWSEDVGLVPASSLGEGNG
ncbi:MAG: hypothetical protein IKZ98_10460 [Clostridia bacterium]|nr:hypothetical protein [Clostridia bacterium]